MTTWFITGTSSGFGEAWMTAALDRGDLVAGTALPGHDFAPIVEKYGNHFLPLTLDVRDRAACREAVDAAFSELGTLDVVVNNAGYGQLGMVEELSEVQIREQLDTNLLGALWVIQAALPHLREQGGGRIFQVSSIGGLTAYPFFGAYNASKWALEAMSQALAGEVRQFGIDVTVIEPTGFATNWWGPALRQSASLPEYVDLRSSVQAGWDSAASGRQSPDSTAKTILALADMQNPPLRILIGAGGIERVEAEYQSRLDVWRAADGLAK